MANYLRTRALIGQEDLSYGIAGSTFSRPNSTGGSQTLHSMGSLSQKIAVATDCAGVDIGAQINCAVTALEPTGGTIYIPAGSYSFATTIVIPRNILLVGLGSNNTALTYTGSGTAIILGDNTPGPLYTRGGLRDFMLIGNGSTVNSIAVYIGGDPAGVVCPSNNYADHMTIRNCRIGGTGTSATGFGVGLQFGNNAFINLFEHISILLNNTGVLLPSNVTNTGENMCFLHCTINNQVTNSMILNQYNTDFYFTNTSFDYNSGPMIGTGIQAEFVCCHFEQFTGAFIDDSAGAATTRVKILGGNVQLNATSGTTAQMFNIGSNAGSSASEFIFRNVTLFLGGGQTVNRIVQYTPRGITPLLIVEGLDMRTAGTIQAISNAQAQFQGLYIDARTGNFNTGTVGSYPVMLAGAQIVTNPTNAPGYLGPLDLLEAGTANHKYLRVASSALQVLDSGFANILLNIPDAGGLYVRGATPTAPGGACLAIGGSSAATATAGASSLPASPVGFLIFNLGGNNIKIPYYNP